jgi:hypothetical protein
MLTLRQIEVTRAIMVTSTVGAVARLLNVSSPSVSWVVRREFVPAQESRNFSSTTAWR